MNSLRHPICCFVLLAASAGCGASVAGNAQPTPQNPYVGTWTGEDPFGQAMAITLKADGRLTLRITGTNRTFTKQGTYTIDPSAKPAHFNIKLTDRDEIRTILQLLDDRHLAFESVNSSDSRPTKFGDQKIVLERQ